MTELLAPPLAWNAPTQPELSAFDAHTRRDVTLDSAAVTKCTQVTRQGQTRYALRGTLADGRVATKYVNRVDYEALNVPVENV